MIAYSIRQIADIVNGEVRGEDTGLVTSVVIDSRQAVKGSMFAAMLGEKVDGHDFIGKAFDNGCTCCIANRVPENETRPVIIVEDVAKALRILAEEYRKTLKIPVIGITGSVGKTTTKEMIASVLSQKFNVLKTDKNFNNELGVPLTLFRIEKEHTVAVVEMGISDFGEMSRLGAMVRPDIAVFTIIGHAHLENLGSREGILKAKTEMIDFMHDSGIVCVNGDDNLLHFYETTLKKVEYGTEEYNDIIAENIVVNSSGTKCTLALDDRKIDVEIPAYGNHMVYATLAGASVGIALGLTDDDIKKGISDYKTVGSRSNIINKGNFIVIDDCYNANPDSVKSGIDSMKSFEGRHICVLGDMLELGDNKENFHYEIGKYAADNDVSAVLCVGDLSRNTVEGACDGGIFAKLFKNNAELISYLNSFIEDNDSILVKASHAMNFVEISDFLRAI